MRGGTEPPEGSADFFSYQMSAVARQRPFADFNLDDTVDDQDLAIWASHYGLVSTASVDMQNRGDANEDGLVNGADFLLWQRQLGETPPEMASLDGMLNAALSKLSAASLVPEPATLPLLILMAAGWCLRARPH